MKAKKSQASKPASAVEKQELTNKFTKPTFGSAKGVIRFKKGWDAPMTKREFDEFIGG